MNNSEGHSYSDTYPKSMEVVIFGDTNDKKYKDGKESGIGTSVEISIGQFKKNFGLFANAAGMKINFSEYIGSNFTKSKYEKFMIDFDCENKFVVFLYFGHGFRVREIDSKTKFPFLTFVTGGRLTEREAKTCVHFDHIKNELNAKRPYSYWLITETCNNYVEEFSGVKYDAPKSLSIYDKNKTGVIKLVKSGNFEITSSSPGEYSNGNYTVGGIFGNAFLFALHKVVKNGESASLSQLADEAYSITKYQTTERKRAGTIGNVQHPVFRIGSETRDSSPEIIPDDSVDSDDSDDKISLGLTKYKHSENSYKLSESSFEGLRNTKMNIGIINGLYGAIKDKEFKNEKEFIDYIARLIGEKNTEYYKDLFIKYGKN